eukprot:m.226612 g.226612  ORF g.226612 m.226612 type:complete len:113 (+) comp15659_c0_seq4:3264-3602(+)
MQLCVVELVDAGSVAVLRTSDFRELHIPLSLLPDGTAAGSIVNLELTAASNDTESQHRKLMALQKSLHAAWSAKAGGSEPAVSSDGVERRISSSSSARGSVSDASRHPDDRQ